MTPAAATTPSAAARHKGLHIGLWVVQGLLVIPFAPGGAMKAFMPMAELAQKMSWVPHFSPATVRFIGLAELAGALGLVLPSALRIRPVLTPLAAIGLFLVMVLAAVFHVQHGELQYLPLNAILGGLALFVAWGRWRKVPITARR